MGACWGWGGEMITYYKYIYFIKVEDKPKTSVWHCRSRSSDDELLGIVEWYGPWRQYCFSPEAQTVFNVTCFDDISNFIRQLREGR